MSDRRSEEPQTEELPLDEVEVEDAAPATTKRRGPPPLPSQRGVEPATSTRPTDLPPPPAARPSAPPPVAAALRPASKAPARLGRSLLPPKPVTVGKPIGAAKVGATKLGAASKPGAASSPGAGSRPGSASKPGAATRSTAEALLPTEPPPPPSPASAKVTKPLRRAWTPPTTQATGASKTGASRPPGPPHPSAPPPPAPAAKATSTRAPAPASSRPTLRSSPPPLTSRVVPAKGSSTPTAAVGAAAQQARLRFLEDEVAALRRDLDRRGGELGRFLDDLDGRGKRAAEALEARAALLDQRLEELTEGVESVTKGNQRVRDQLEGIAREVEELKSARDEVRQALDDVRATVRGYEQNVAAKLEALRAELDALRDQEPLDATALRDEILALTERQQKELVAAYLEGAKQELAKQLATLGGATPRRRSTQRSSEPALTDIRGVGPASAKKLSGAGVTSPGQVAAWSDDDIARLHRKLGVSVTRLRTWRSNAAELAAQP